MTAFFARGTAFAAGLAATVALGVPPAAATGGAVTFDGTAFVWCFGCGTTTGSAELDVSGALADGTVLVDAPVHASYVAQQPNDPITCLITGTAQGTTGGAVSVSFNWTRVGAWAVITTQGDINGMGTALFVITDPIGIPCRTYVWAHVTGTVFGA